jgi:3'-5' exoribonuclease
MEAAATGSPPPELTRSATGATPVRPADAAPGSGGVASLQPGRPLAGRFAVARKDRLTSRNGSPYLAVELRDRSGSIPARIFREADQLGARFERGDAIEVRGKVERFRGELQGEITALRRLEPGSFDPGEFLPAAYRSSEELQGFFEHLSREVHDADLRRVVETAVGAEPVARELLRAPCSRGGHHAYLGGLLEHTVAVGTLVGEVCQLHPRLDSDLLMAAALLHDIGKTREFTYGAEFGISDEGRMLGHLAIGAEIVGAAARNLAPERRLALLHCILSHHGPEAAGRAKSSGIGRGGFASPEALALFRLNSLDAGVKGALEHGL